MDDILESERRACQHIDCNLPATLLDSSNTKEIPLNLLETMQLTHGMYAIKAN